MKLNIKQAINRNGYVIYPIVGKSMYPLLKEKTDRVVLKKASTINLFDIVLFKRRKNVYVLHRVIDINDDVYTIIGDNACHIDKLKKKDIIGKMTEIYRDTSSISVNDEKYQQSVKFFPYYKSDVRMDLLKNPNAFFFKRKKDAYYELIKLAVFGEYDSKRISCLTPIEIDNLVSLLFQKKALHILGFAIDKKGLKIDTSISEVAVVEYNNALLRGTRINYAINQIDLVLSKNNIKHIFLKGAEIKDLYKNHLRVSNDIDIYVNPNDLMLTKKVLIEAFKGEEHSKTPHDESVVLNDLGFLVEIHHNIATNLPEDLMHVLQDPISRAKRNKEQPYRYHLSKKDSTLFFLSHNARHINRGEFWASSIIDYYYLKNDFDLKSISEIRLNKFNEVYSHIVEHILKGSSLNETEREFEKILFMENEQLDLSIIVGRNNRFAYIFSRIFPSYKTLKHVYPILNKCFILYPFLLIYRLLKITLFTSRSGKKELKAIKEKNNTKSIVNILKESGLEEYIINPDDHKTRF